MPGAWLACLPGSRKHWPVLVHLCMQEARVGVRHISGAAVAWSLCSGCQLLQLCLWAWHGRADPSATFFKLRSCPAAAPGAEAGKNLLGEKQALFICSGSQRITVTVLETRP